MEIQTQKKLHIIQQSRVKSFCQTLSLRRGEGEESLPTVRLLEKCTLGLALHCVAVEKNTALTKKKKKTFWIDNLEWQLKSHPSSMNSCVLVIH